MVEGLDANGSPNYKELADPWMGGEHGEDQFHRLDSGCQEWFMC